MTNQQLLCDIYALLKIHDCTMEIWTHTNESQKELGWVFSKQQEIDCRQGKLHGWITISDLDLRHMINSSMQQHGGHLTAHSIQQIHMLMISRVTGCHTSKWFMIAAASWKMKIHCLNSCKLVHWMGYMFCFQKMPASENTKSPLWSLMVTLLSQTWWSLLSCTWKSWDWFKAQSWHTMAKVK